MTDVLTPDDLHELYSPLVEKFVPRGEDDQEGPPGMLVLVTVEEGVIVGPILGDLSEPEIALNALHPAMLPGKPHITQAAFAVEAVADHPASGRRMDVTLFWSATDDGAWMAIAPFTRTWVSDGDDGRTPLVVWTPDDDPDVPPVWKEVEGEEFATEAVLVALRNLVRKDPATEPDPNVRYGEFGLN